MRLDAVRPTDDSLSSDATRYRSFATVAVLELGETFVTLGKPFTGDDSATAGVVRDELPIDGEGRVESPSKPKSPRSLQLY